MVVLIELPGFEDVHEPGLASLKKVGNVVGECRIRDNLSIAYRESGRLAETASCPRAALKKWVLLGDIYGERQRVGIRSDCASFDSRIR